MWKVPLSDIDFGEEEIAAVTGVLRSKWLTMGEVTRRFERAFAEYIGVKHAFAVANCTAALELAYKLVGVSPGDEVLMPSLTFVASANTAVALGGVPIFGDIESERDLNLSARDLDKKITSRTRAISLVHYAGYPCDMEAILKMARAHQLPVVEDCAHAPGARSPLGAVGTLGDVGCFSFFSNKNLTTGEGGMIVTSRDDYADRIRLLRSHGMTTLTLDRHLGHAFTYDVVEPGYNYRIDEMRAALGLAQLKRLPENGARRRERVLAYRAHLASAPGVTIPFADREEGAAFHIFPILLDDAGSRPAFMQAMRDAGIQTSIHYPPIHRFTHYRKATVAAELPVTDKVADRLVTLPLYPTLPMADLELVARTVCAVQVRLPH